MLRMNGYDVVVYQGPGLEGGLHKAFKRIKKAVKKVVKKVAPIALTMGGLQLVGSAVGGRMAKVTSFFGKGAKGVFGRQGVLFGRTGKTATVTYSSGGVMQPFLTREMMEIAIGQSLPPGVAPIVSESLERTILTSRMNFLDRAAEMFKVGLQSKVSGFVQGIFSRNEMKESGATDEEIAQAEELKRQYKALEDKYRTMAATEYRAATGESGMETDVGAEGANRYYYDQTPDDGELPAAMPQFSAVPVVVVAAIVLYFLLRKPGKKGR